MNLTLNFINKNIYSDANQISLQNDQLCNNTLLVGLQHRIIIKNKKALDNKTKYFQRRKTSDARTSLIAPVYLCRVRSTVIALAELAESNLVI